MGPGADVVGNRIDYLYRPGDSIRAAEGGQSYAVLAGGPLGWLGWVGAIDAGLVDRLVTDLQFEICGIGQLRNLIGNSVVTARRRERHHNRNGDRRL